MNFLAIGMLIMQAARLACGTCVFESDFGFVLNCNFKKSGLFRVRNLGGLKAHFGLGFSLGDELGFAESLGNLEGGRRRAISYKNGPPPPPPAPPTRPVGVLPASAQQVPLRRPPPEKRLLSRPPLAISPELRDSLTRQTTVKPPVPLMTEARPLPLGVPAFRPIPQKRLAPVPVPVSVATSTTQRRRNGAVIDAADRRVGLNDNLVESSYAPQVTDNRTFHAPDAAVPAFQAMPNSVSPITAVLRSADEAAEAAAHLGGQHPNYLQFEEPKFDLKDISVEELAAAANVSVETIRRAIQVREQQLRAEQRAALASKLREEFIRTSTAAPTTTTTTTTTRRTTARAPVAYFAATNTIHENKVSKVMNAPKEYYPVGYDKNFDDNFKSKVDLPPTRFSCARQKHFPGLYADPDLGCMVFHVCALTDDGLVRKSFLCPESTLFDQTILKCNWWFYVDCASSPSVYDSNIPIAKSYQLMKSLTYFSKLTKSRESGERGGGDGGGGGGGGGGGLDIQSLKESMDEEALKSDQPYQQPDPAEVQDEHQHLGES